MLNVWLYAGSVAVCYVMPTTSLQPAAIPSPGGWQGWWNVVIQEATGGVQQEVTQGHKAADKGTLGGAFRDTTTTAKCGTHRSVWDTDTRTGAYKLPGGNLKEQS